MKSISSILNNISVFKIYKVNSYSFARNVKSNYDKYLEQKTSQEKTLNIEKTEKVQQNIKISDKQKYSETVEKPINTLKLSPYFEGAVDSKELNYKTLTRFEKTYSIRGPREPNRNLNKSQQRFIKKVKIVKDYVKRQMHDSSIFRNGLASEDLANHSDLVKRAMSIDNASIGEFRQARMLEIRKLFARHERDTASPPIMACALNEKVLHMVSHLKTHPNDTTTKLMLSKISTKRRKYMMYLKRIDYNTYAYILKYYGLKDFPDTSKRVDMHLLRTNYTNK